MTCSRHRYLAAQVVQLLLCGTIEALHLLKSPCLQCMLCNGGMCRHTDQYSIHAICYISGIAKPKYGKESEMICTPSDLCSLCTTVKTSILLQRLTDSDLRQRYSGQ